MHSRLPQYSRIYPPRHVMQLAVTMREIEIADLNPVGCPTAAPGAAAGTPPPACMCDDPQIAPTKPKIADDCKNFCAKNDECQFVEYLRNGGSPICNWFKECIKGTAL